DLRAVSSLNLGGMAYNHLFYEMKWASWTSPESDPSIAALWSVLEIWMYEHLPTLAPARTGDAAYPYAASWIGAVRRRMPLAASRRAWRVLPVGENFVDRRGHYEDLLKRLAPPVRFELPEEEVDPEDIPHADRIIRYENSDGEQVEVTIPIASPPHRRSYDVVPEHYAAERRRDRRGSDDREPQAETSLRQEGPSLDLGQGSHAGTFQRYSNADRGAAPFVYVDPTRHSFGGASSSRPPVPPPAYYFRGSGPQPWGVDPLTYWYEMERMRQAQILEAQRQFMAMPQPY
ncbi:hypothetical protein SOVF_083620, partial [Spinacia oleracea]